MDRFALEYLCPVRETFWRWNENGEVVEWADGTTIAFRGELLELLRALAPQGLPRLGALLLLLASTRDAWRASTAEPGILAGLLGEVADRGAVKTNESADQARVSKIANRALARVLLTQVLEKLRNVSLLEPSLRTSLAAKIMLTEMVFADRSWRGTPEVAQQVVEQLDFGLGEELAKRQAMLPAGESGAGSLLAELHSLDQGLARLDAEQLKLRLETGLDQVPQAADLEMPSAATVRALLAELTQDEELAGLAKLALNLMAAVTLPRAVMDREELQMGGVSDITNRGPLDRLLLSELAHDDLTLAVRVAVNEAMYLRRESPPRTPPRQRSVLLEAGIRSWGVPRVFSTAVALALAATSERDVEMNAFRAKQADVHPVDLKTRAGLVKHLAALEAELHPGRALDAFETALNDVENPAEPVLVVADDVFADADFQRSLGESALLPLHIATVNRQGELRLLERTLRGTKLLREATLDLDLLFAEPARRTTELIDRDWPEEVPAIFYRYRFPLRLSHSIDPKRTWGVAGRGVLALTHDNRLMFWTRPNVGAIQLADNASGGALWWASSDPFAHEAHAVVGHLAPNGLHLLQIDLDEHRCRSQHLQLDRGVQAISAHQGAVFGIFHRHVQVVAKVSGQVVQSLELPSGVSWQQGRFFRNVAEGKWYALSFDGRTARLESVLPEKHHCPLLLTLFEQEGVDGPIGVTAIGDLYFTATGELRKVSHDLRQPLKVSAISPDGKRVELSSTQPTSQYYKPSRLINVETATATAQYSPQYWMIPPELVRNLSPTSLRHRFTHIGVNVDGKLTLATRKDQFLTIDYERNNDQIRLTSQSTAIAEVSLKTFSPVALPRGVGFQLTCATWDDGSAAYLDTRGLLHLKSANQSIPECTIVLTDGELSGWCADSRLWGRHYFLGQPSADKQPVFNSAIRAFAELLR